MAIRFDAATDQIATDGWSGTIVSMTCWGRLESDINTDGGLVWVTPNSGSNSTRILLGTNSTGTQMILYDQAFATLNGPNMTVGTWYCFGIVINGTSWTLYHGTTPSSLSTVSGTRTSVSAPGALRLNASVERWPGDIANFKVWTRALSIGDVEDELETYDVVNATSLVRKHSFRTTSLTNEQGGGANFTAGSTAVALVPGPSALIDVTGALSGTLPSPVGTLTGDYGTTGALAGTLPSPAGTLVAEVEITGALAGTLPLPVARLAEVLPLAAGVRVGTATLESGPGWGVGAAVLDESA